MVNFFSRLGDVVRWYPTGATREEKKLIFKIDLLVLVYACLAFFTKYLDVTALSKSSVTRSPNPRKLTVSQQMHTCRA